MGLDVWDKRRAGNGGIVGYRPGGAGRGLFDSGGEAMRRLIWIGLVVSVLAACGGGAKAATGDDVVAAFKMANLEAERARPMTKDDYGAAPYVCTGTRFLIPSLGEEAGRGGFPGGGGAGPGGLGGSCPG